MKTINIVKVLSDHGIDVSGLKTQRPEEREQASQFFEFRIGPNEVARVESTATSVMEEVLRLPLLIQQLLFRTIARAVTAPGEQAVLEGDKKRRGARVVRLAPSGNDPSFDVHELLLTH